MVKGIGYMDGLNSGIMEGWKIGILGIKLSEFNPYKNMFLEFLVFAVNPNFETKDYTKTALLGGVLGFLAYATYDLTNYSVLKTWPLKLTIIDIAWGTFLTATISTISLCLTKFIK